MIKGLTDVVLPRFPNLGRLRKGGEKQNGQYGKDLTYFRFTSERDEIVKAFTDAYGPQPAALHVYLPYANLDDNFAAWKEHWVAGGLQHRCDGETCVIWLDKASGKYQNTPRACPGGCDEVGRLTVILPELLRAGYVGYVTLETHSLHDIMDITASLLAVSEARTGNALGLRGIEFILRRKPEQISTPGWGDNKRQRQRVEKWLVSIEPVPTWAETALQLVATPPAGLLAAPVATTSGFVDQATGEIVSPPDDAENGDFAVEHDAPADPDAELLTQVQAELITEGQKEYTSPEPEKLARNTGGSLRELLGQDADLHAAFVAWAFGAATVNDLTDSQRRALVRFVNLKQYGDKWLPSDRAILVAGAFKRKYRPEPLFEDEQA